MAEYRIFFLDGGQAIIARDEFKAATESAALVIARWLFDACSDRCHGFELWSGRNRLHPNTGGGTESSPFNSTLWRFRDPSSRSSWSARTF